MAIFGFGEKREILNFIATWEPTLSQAYKQAWENFKKKKDIVVKELGLTEMQGLYLTKRELARYVAYDTKRKAGINDSNLSKVSKNRGNTHIFELMKKMTDIHKEYTEKCGNCVKSFDARIAQLSSRR